MKIYKLTPRQRRGLEEMKKLCVVDHANNQIGYTFTENSDFFILLKETLRTEQYTESDRDELNAMAKILKWHKEKLTK